MMQLCKQFAADIAFKKIIEPIISTKKEKMRGVEKF